MRAASDGVAPRVRHDYVIVIIARSHVDDSLIVNHVVVVVVVVVIIIIVLIDDSCIDALRWRANLDVRRERAAERQRQ